MTTDSPASPSPRPQRLGRLARRIRRILSDNDLVLRNELDQVLAATAHMQHRLDSIVADLASLRNHSEAQANAWGAQIRESTNRIDDLILNRRHAFVDQLLEDAAAPPAAALLSGLLSNEEAVAELEFMRSRRARMNNSNLATMFGDIDHRTEAWARCEIVLACPVTSDGVARLLPEAKVVIPGNLDEVVALLHNTRYERIGIASPWLMDQIVADPTALTMLVRACGDHVLYVDGNCTGIQNHVRRRTLHDAGFYEVGLIADSASERFTSVATTGEGAFDLRSEQPALPGRVEKWRTHIASRLALLNDESLPWQSSGVLQIGHARQLLSAYPGTRAFALCGQATPLGTAGALRVEGTAGWHTGSDGFAGLIASCSGPGPERCYRAHVQWHRLGVFVSIWRHLDDWSELTFAQVPPELVGERAGGGELPIWLEVRPDGVALGSGETKLIHCEDTSLPRVSRAGIAIASSGNWLRDFTSHATAED